LDLNSGLFLISGAFVRSHSKCPLKPAQTGHDYRSVVASLGEATPRFVQQRAGGRGALQPAEKRRRDGRVQIER